MTHTKSVASNNTSSYLFLFRCVLELPRERRNERKRERTNRCTLYVSTRSVCSSCLSRLISAASSHPQCQKNVTPFFSFVRHVISTFFCKGHTVSQQREQGRKEESEISSFFYDFPALAVSLTRATRSSFPPKFRVDSILSCSFSHTHR